MVRQILSVVWLCAALLATGCGDTVIVDTGIKPGQCKPKCTGRQCGSDGCGGVCGGCAVGEFCRDGKCYVGSDNPDSWDDTFQPWPDNVTQPDLPADVTGLPDTNQPPTDAFTPPKDLGSDPGTVVPADKCFFTYDDADGDGFGSQQTKTEVCGIDSIPNGKAVKYGDCNDFDALISPGGTEICDDVDNDCDGVVDDGCDLDDDGHCTKLLPILGTPSTCPNGADDCDDGHANAFPGNIESPGDGVDNNCDGVVDEAVQCPGQCTGHLESAFLCAMEICQGQYSNPTFSSPTGDNIDSAWDAVNHFGNAGNDLAPFGGDSYALFATGPAKGTSHTTDLSGGSSKTDNVSGSGDEMFDAVEFVVTMTAPAIAQGFSIDYVFMSEEYEEFIGTAYNDKFFMLLKAPQTTSGQWKIINFTDCRNPASYHDFVDANGKKQCYLAINTALSEACPNAPTNINGTGFECGSADDSHGSSTGWLYTSWPIQANETFQLKFHIHDTADGIYDSLVILDNFHWLTAPFTPGTASHN